MNERAMRGKKKMRKRLAALSFSEKVKILEQLRDRSLAIAASGLRRKTAGNVGKAGERNQQLEKDKK